MSLERALRFLAFAAVVLPVGASFYFFVFWRWFAFWRRHPVLTYTMMFGTFAVLGVVGYLLRRDLFAHRIDVPLGVAIVGWIVLAFVNVFGWIADRQIGFRVRSFLPFFEDQGRIELRTTGAYGVVRHPIYAAGLGFQLGLLLVTGYLALAVALLVFGLSALWFTRQEERRLVELLDDPGEYERYRQRVPALLPRIRRSRDPRGEPRR